MSKSIKEKISTWKVTRILKWNPFPLLFFFYIYTHCVFAPSHHWKPNTPSECRVALRLHKNASRGNSIFCQRNVIEMDNVWNGWKTNGSNWSIASRESSRGRMAHAGPLTSHNTVDTRVNTDASGPGAVRSATARERNGSSQNQMRARAPMALRVSAASPVTLI